MQAVLAYTAPDSTACSVEVSESAAYSPVVFDVDGSKFTGAALDSRTGNVPTGRDRIFVIGKRAAGKALDGRFYSRALQAHTLHYYRITCGTDTATGTFRTTNIPLGNTYPEPYPVDPSNPGQYAWPTQHFDQQQENFVDPTTGALIHRMVGPGSLPNYPEWGNLPTMGVFDDSGSANPWSTTSSALPATYSANGSTATTKLFAPANVASVWNLWMTYSADITHVSSIAVTLTGTATGSTAADRSVTMCLTADGVNCVSGSAQPVQDLSACASGCTVGNSTPLMNYWFGGATPGLNNTDIGIRTTVATYDNTTGAVVYNSGHYFNPKWTAGSRVWIGTTPYRFTAFTDIQNAAIASGLGTGDKTLVGHNFGVLIWKTNNTSGSSVTLSNVRYGLGLGYALTFWDLPSLEHCHPQLVQRASSGRWGYHCVLSGTQGSAHLAWVDKDSADTRLLGMIQIPGQSDASGNGWSGMTYFSLPSFDHSDPNVMYHVRSDQNSKKVLLRLTYSGDNTGRADNTIQYGASTSPWAITTNLTPYNPSGEHYDLGTLLQRFDSHFDPTSSYWTGWDIYHVTPDGKLVVIVKPGQDAIPGGWVVVVDPSITPDATHNPVIAAAPTAGIGGTYSPLLRWGMFHEVSSANGSWLAIEMNAATWTGGSTLFHTTLAQALDATSTTIYTAGEPGWDIARVGDTVMVDSEIMLITAKVSSTEWQVTRGYRSTTAASHATSTNVFMFAGSQGRYSSAFVFWDYANDPHGTNAGGSTVAVDAPYFIEGHGTYAKGHTTMVLMDGACRPLTGESSGVCAGAKNETFPATLGRNADAFQAMFFKFAGKRATANDYGYPSHMSRTQWLAAPDWEQDWVLDAHSLYGGYSMSRTFTKVSGTTQIYSATGTWNRKHVPVLAVCGTHPLKDVSGPGALIQDGTTGAYTYCIPSNAGECRSSSTTTDVYVNCPNLVTLSCTAHDTGSQPSEDVCVYEPVDAAGAPVVQRLTSKNDRTGSLSTRVLARAPERWRRQWTNYTSNGKALPGGEWALYLARWVDDQYSGYYAVKVPPFPNVDSAIRNTFSPVTVQVNSVPPGTDNVVAEFGYGTNYYCTSRSEVCVATGTGPVNETTPFAWASESYSGLPCAAGCTLTIPALPQRVVYYRLKYRTATGTVLLTGPARVAVTQ
jgi:hypothetical protein